VRRPLARFAVAYRLASHRSAIMWRPLSRPRTGAGSRVGTRFVVKKKMGSLSTLFIPVVSLWFFAWLYLSVWPASEAVVTLPMANAVARFQTWAGFLKSQPFVLRVDTPHGTTSAELWTNWGPADDLALYQTPEDWLVGIGGGGESVIIDVTKKSGPRIVRGDEQKKTDNKKWKFFGYIQGGGLVSPHEQKECIALLGSGWSPYRKEYQVPHHC
jgi:hypothetical protein